MKSYNTLYCGTAAVSQQAPHKSSTIITVFSVITLAISVLSFLFAVLMFGITNATISDGDNVGFEMIGYIGGVMIFAVTSLLLAITGLVAGGIMTVVVLVKQRFRLIWMLLLSIIACVAAFWLTMSAL